MSGSHLQAKRQICSFIPPIPGSSTRGERASAVAARDMATALSRVWVEVPTTASWKTKEGT